MGGSDGKGKNQTRRPRQWQSTNPHLPSPPQSTMHLTPEVEAKFYAFREESPGNNDCWLWVGPTNGSGYGCLKLKGKSLGAHRIAWVLKHRLALPSYHQVRRKCKHKACVRPAHLRRLRRPLELNPDGSPAKPYYVVHPPKTQAEKQTFRPEGKIDGRLAPKPRVERYMRETKEVKETVLKLVASLDGLFEVMEQNRDGLSHLHARLRAMEEAQKEEAERSQSEAAARRAEWSRLSALVMDSLTHTPSPANEIPELPLLARSPRDEREAERHADHEPDRAGERVLGKLLAELFHQSVGREPTREEYPRLEEIYGLAQAAAGSRLGEENGPDTAAAVFAQWLGNFANSVREDPGRPRFVKDFEASVGRQMASVPGPCFT